MDPKGKSEVPAPRTHEPRSNCRRQTSDEELEEVRKRGCYVVLPPVEEMQEDWKDLIS